jgi:ubiquitin-protein ligase
MSTKESVSLSAFLTITHRRLEKEIVTLHKNMSTYKVDILPETQDTSHIYIKITTPNKNDLLFVLKNSSYPFKPPIRVEWNGENYLSLVKRMPKYVEYLYHHPEEIYITEESIRQIQYSKSCLCCTSVLCADNWTPVYRMENILNEIIHHNALKRQIMYKRMVQYIIDKKLLPTEFAGLFFDYLIE